MKNTLLSLFTAGTISTIACIVLTANHQTASTDARPCTVTLSLDLRELPVPPATFNHNPYVQFVR